MITFTKEQLIASAHARIEFAEMMLAGELEPLKERTWSIELELARIALASLDAGSDSNDHPAQGPLSNYRLHRIIDILRKAAAQSDGGNIGYAMSDAVKAIDELLEVRKAEPVGEFYHEKQGGWYQISEGDKVPDNRRIPLYAAPPAPVVPDEKPVPNPLKMYAVDAVAAIAEVRGWNACRAAMLNGGKS
ncbi:hypothetical protein BN1086_01031 [Citrobacter koseri]|uniref:Prophage protein n=1 Tax=Citrobacter koseri TaxID=545 RepID=A0A078LCZ5_CITKO|nr:hypothetical protein BN1086_01031 [Citrobacter koseri]